MAESADRPAGQRPLRNPFRDAMMRRAYDEVVVAYDAGRMVSASGRRVRSHGGAVEFWQGYDNSRPQQWDAVSKRLLAYAYFRAGRDVRTRELHEMAKSSEERRAFHWVRFAGVIQPAEVVFVGQEPREVWLIGSETQASGAEVLAPIEMPGDLAKPGAGG